MFNKWLSIGGNHTQGVPVQCPTKTFFPLRELRLSVVQKTDPVSIGGANGVV